MGPVPPFYVSARLCGTFQLLFYDGVTLIQQRFSPHSAGLLWLSCRSHCATQKNPHASLRMSKLCSCSKGLLPLPKPALHQ